MSRSKAIEVEAANSKAASDSHGRLFGFLGFAVWILLFGLALVLSLTLPENVATKGVGIRWWPAVISGAGLGLGFLGLVYAIVRSTVFVPDEPRASNGHSRLLAIIGCLVGYGILWYFIDFRLSTLILFAALVWVAGGRTWKGLVLFPILSTAALWLLFGYFLKVPL